MKIIVLLTILTLSLASIAIAGLNHNVPNSAIAVYYFEKLEDTSWHPSEISLTDGATLTKNGIAGKGLQITKNGRFRARFEFSPASIGTEFSITARVKMPKQAKTALIISYNVATSAGDIAGNIFMSIATDGNLVGLRGVFNADSELVHSTTLKSENLNVANNKWHHIAFTKYGHTYAIFADGVIVDAYHTNVYHESKSHISAVYIGGTGDGIQGNAIIDNLGFFETGFSPFEIKAMYENGLYNFLEVMPVDPQAKIATTWGEIKAQQ